MKLDSIKCPNCGATNIDIDILKNIYRCTYCKSQLIRTDGNYLSWKDNAIAFEEYYDKAEYEAAFNSLVNVGKLCDQNSFECGEILKRKTLEVEKCYRHITEQRIDDYLNNHDKSGAEGFLSFIGKALSFADFFSNIIGISSVPSLVIGIVNLIVEKMTDEIEWYSIVGKERQEFFSLKKLIKEREATLETMMKLMPDDISKNSIYMILVQMEEAILSLDREDYIRNKWGAYTKESRLTEHDREQHKMNIESYKEAMKQ